MLSQMQKYLLKAATKYEFKANLGTSEEQPVFYSALKKLLNGVTLDAIEQNSLGNIIHRQYFDSNTCLSGAVLTNVEAKEAFLLFRANLLICLLKKFNKQDDIIQQQFNLNWFIHQRDKLVNETEIDLPCVLSLDKSIKKTKNFYTYVPIITTLIALVSLNYGKDKNALSKLGLNINYLINRLFIAYVVRLTTTVALKERPHYYYQASCFFKEQTLLAMNVEPLIQKLTRLIENNLDTNNHAALKLA